MILIDLTRINEDIIIVSGGMYMMSKEGVENSEPTPSPSIQKGAKTKDTITIPPLHLLDMCKMSKR